MNPQGSIERELKLGVPSGFSLARLPQHLKNYVASPARFSRLHTVYYDSPDLRLLRWGCSLRFRRGEGWTLKLPVLDTNDGAALARSENVFPGDATQVPEGALDLATAFLRGTQVGPVAELRTVRVKRDFRCNGSSVAQVVEDDVRVVKGSTVAQRFAQLEIELAGNADAAALDTIAAALQREGAGKADPVPKNVRALQSDGEPEIAIPEIDKDAGIAEVVRAAMGAALTQYMRSEPLLRVSDDIEAVHKARVAVRKLRSHLHSFAPVLDQRWARALREQLRALQDVLAPVRDADVFHERMGTLTQRIPHADTDDARSLLDTLVREKTATRDSLRAYLHSQAYVALLDEVIEGVANPHFRSGLGSARDEAPAIMKRVFKKVRACVRQAGSQPPDRALHRIRIKAKHLRYASESFGDVAGTSAKQYAQQVESLQEMLGAQHDGVVAVTRLRALAPSSRSSFVAGELAMLAYEDGTAACRSWRACWSSIAKKRQRFW